MTIDKFTKRIQSRLTSKKVQFQGKTVPLWKCREFYEQHIPEEKRLDPSEEDLNRVVELIETYCSATDEPETTTIETIPTPETFDIPVESLPCLQPPEPEKSEPETTAIAPASTESKEDDRGTGREIIPAGTTGGITHAEVTQAINQAIAQVGEQGNSEALQLLTTLAEELSSDIADTQEMVTALVTAYLGKRQNILASAIGTLNTLRSAQTESFQAGLNPSFFGAKGQKKREFLSAIAAKFN